MIYDKAIDLRQLKSFVAVARTRSFTRAAEEQHVVQSAVSQHVRKLETELGLELFHRGARIRLTDAGERVLRRAEAILFEADALRQDADDVRELIRGRVAIGSLQWLPVDLPQLLAVFLQKYPGVTCELNEDTTPRMLATVLTGQLDFAFVSFLGSTLPPEFELHPFAREELVIVGHPDSKLSGARGDRAPLHTLNDVPFISFHEGLNLHGTVNAALREAGVEPRRLMFSNEQNTVRSLAAHGLGLTLLPQSVANAPGPALRTWSVSPKPLECTVALAWRAGSRLGPAASALRDVVQETWPRVE
jgi:DNA-binding transcriptional LysR family regulator